MKNKKILAIADVHSTSVDKKCWKLMLAFTRQYKPDIFINLGDMVDYSGISKFSRDDLIEQTKMSVNDENDVVNGLLDDVDDALPRKCEKIFFEGNHEDRANRYMAGHPQTIGALDVRRNLHLQERGYKWIPYGDTHKVGLMYFLHGIYHNKYHAYKHVDNYGACVFYGHLHTIQEYHKETLDHIKCGVAIGCLCNKNPDYVKGNRPNSWVHGFLAATVFPNGEFIHQHVRIWNNKIVWGNRIISV